MGCGTTLVPLTWADGDTDATIRQIKENNRRYLSICEGIPPARSGGSQPQTNQIIGPLSLARPYKQLAPCLIDVPGWGPLDTCVAVLAADRPGRQ